MTRTQARQSPLRGGTALLLCLLGVVACTAPPYAPPTPKPRNAAPAVVPVLLTGIDGNSSFEVRVDGQALTFRPAAKGVSCSDGRTGARIVSGSSRSTIEIGSRRYIGTLTVEPRAGGGLRGIQAAPIEDYVAGVVCGEVILWSSRPAELEAQSIAARTYAVRRLTGSVPWLRDDTGDQRYVGVFLPAKTSEQPIVERVARAVRATRGMILVDASGRPLEANFHASCGGRTATPAVFGRAESLGLGQGVACAPCQERAASGDDTSPFHWSTTVPADEWSRYVRDLGIGTRLVALRPASFDGSGRWLTVELTGDGGRTTVTFEQMRRRFGPDRLKSANILHVWPGEGARIEQGTLFEGQGRGHGVGLCQEGTHGYAERGLSGRQILEHYFPGARIETLVPEA